MSFAMLSAVAQKIARTVILALLVYLVPLEKYVL